MGRDEVASRVSASHPTEQAGSASSQPPATALPLRVGAVDDEQLLLDGLTSCLAGIPGIQLVAATRTVDELLACAGPIDVVMLDLKLKDGSDPVDNVARLVGAGHRVLIVSSHTDREHVIATTTAGAEGYITKDSEITSLVQALREVAAGETAYSPELAFCWARDHRADRPKISDQEERVLLAYASGATLDAAARRAGIKPGTAKQYLDRVKEKYRQVGRPASTKVDLAQRVREDGLNWRRPTRDRFP